MAVALVLFSSIDFGNNDDLSGIEKDKYIVELRIKFTK